MFYMSFSWKKNFLTDIIAKIYNDECKGFFPLFMGCDGVNFSVISGQKLMMKIFPVKPQGYVRTFMRAKVEGGHTECMWKLILVLAVLLTMWKLEYIGKEYLYQRCEKLEKSQHKSTVRRIKVTYIYIYVNIWQTPWKTNSHPNSKFGIQPMFFSNCASAVYSIMKPKFMFDSFQFLWILFHHFVCRHLRLVY